MVEKNSKTKQDKIEEIVDKKILEAKLTITEKRLSFVLFLMAGIVAVFGIFLPLYQSNLLENKTEKAITQMQEEFDQIVGKQLREPELKCFFNGRDLTDQTIELVYSFGKTQLLNNHIQIINVGEKLVKDFSIYIYVKSLTVDRDIWEITRAHFYRLDYVDENGYDFCFKNYQDINYPLHPKQPYTLTLINPITRINKDDIGVFEFQYLIKVYYDQLTPISIPFKMIVKHE